MHYTVCAALSLHLLYTYFVAMHTEDSCDTLWSERCPTYEAVRLAIPTCCLLNIIQPSGETPANTC